MQSRSLRVRIDVKLSAMVVMTLVAVALSIIASVPYGNVELRAQEPKPVGSLERIVAVSPNLVVAPGDLVSLSINVYGRQGQDTEERNLPRDVDFSWTAYGGILVVATGTSAVYRAPDMPGNYTVTASAGSECVGTASECTATFRITVRRVSELTGPDAPPRNPEGEIPAILTDSHGQQYEVFTPEEGGTFMGDGFRISAAPGIVPNGEIVGIRMCISGDASNAGMSEHRYTLAGARYEVCAVDASGDVVNSYRLDGPAEVCIPLPDQLRSEISNAGLFGIDSSGDLIALTSTVHISPDLMVCGNLSTLPLSVAAGVPGTPPEPAATLEPAPESMEQLPPTGGSAPSSSSLLIWIIVFGGALVVSGVSLVMARRSEL